MVGPHVSACQWGSVREDYSEDGSAWEYFPHDHARSRAFRWGEDGLAGVCDRWQHLCFAIGLWNERDEILKGTPFRADQPRGQSRRGCEGGVVAPGFHSDSFMDAMAVQASPGCVPVPGIARRERPSQSSGASSLQTRRATQIAIVSVFSLMTWHYIKQVYGVARIGASYRKIALTGREVRVLRYGLYPLWLIGAGRVLARGSGARCAGFDVGVDLIPNGVSATARVVAILCAAAIAVVIARASARCKVLPPPLVVAPYLAAFLWLAAPTNYFGATIALGAVHAMQYMACCHRAEVALGLAPLTRRSALRWAEIFGGAACGGLIISLWLPQRLDTTVTVAGAPLLFTAVCFVFLNLHHYLIDAVIWRSTGDLVKAMNRRPSPA